MTTKKIYSKLKDFINNELSKYQNIYDMKMNKNEVFLYENIQRELLKYHKETDIMRSPVSRISYIVIHPRRDDKTWIYIKCMKTMICIEIYYYGQRITSKGLNAQMYAEIVKAFVNLDNSFDKIVEEIYIEYGKDKKIYDILSVTIKTLIKKKFEDKIFAETSFSEDKLILHISKSANKITLEINIKKFKNEFDEILDEIEHFLKVLNYDWLEFDYTKITGD